MKTLVVVEHDNQSLKPNSYNVVGAASQFEGTIDVLVAGHQCQSVVDAAARLSKVDQVLHIDNDKLEHFMPDVMAATIEHFATSYDNVLMPASTFGKNILPRVAAKADMEQLADVIAIIDPKTFKRPIYAGNAIATVKSLDEKVFMTVRPTAFDAVPEASTPCKVDVKEVALEASNTQFVRLDASESERPELTSARVVVSGGRALQNEENFKMIEKLADKLDAAVGASRAAVDAGYVPNDYQVGQTGKIVAPELYIAIGISGAIQHIAGMKDSKVIVAINKDPEAPIFQVADYGLVADLFEVVPKLIELV